MNTKRKTILFVMIVIWCLISVRIGYPACSGADMTGTDACLYYGEFDTVAGPLGSAQFGLQYSSMQPYQLRNTADDTTQWYAMAKTLYDAGNQFRQSLLLIDLNFDPANPPTNPTPQQNMILNPKLNYETAGLLANISDIENKLTTARDTFAYDHFINYQPLDNSSPQAHLINTLKLMVNIYLMIGDEFLIDALEFRFSDTTIGVDIKLNEQIDLLDRARIYYQKAINTFTYGFSPAVDTNIYIADYFDEPVFSLFHLATERLSMALREKSSKQLAKLISPVALEEANARNVAGATLKDVYLNTYIVAAATSQRTGENFLAYGGQRLVNALNTLRNQGNIYRENLNPLGYDDRYVPMQDFSKLYSDASNYKNSAFDSQNTLSTAIRDFDTDAEKMKTALFALAENPGGYKTQLASLTGISINDSEFLVKVTIAGDDLYDCPIDAENFGTCVQNKTKGIIGSKYNQIRDAQIRVERALVQKQNLLDMVALENKRHNESIIIQNKYNAAYQDALKNYLSDMKDARTITKEKTKEKGEKSISRTVTSYFISNPQLNLQITQEIAFQKAQNDLTIAQINLTDEITIKNYLNNIAETEIEMGLAIQTKNTAIADFENGLKERDNLVSVYKKALEQVNYTVDTVAAKIPEVRILRCQAAIDLSRNLNNAVHYAYLAAKALEYKYMKPLVNVSVLNETMNIHDLYKIQTVEDLTSFLNKLSAYDSCAWGSVSRTTIAISLAKDIMGLTDKYLNPNNALSTADVAKLRYQRIQAYLSNSINRSDNSLLFDFSTSLNNNAISKFNKYNLKVWYGLASPPCDPVPTKGAAVKFLTTQTAAITPYVNLTQKGHSTYLNKNKEILAYVPVSEYLNLLSEDIGATLATTGRFSAYVNRDPDSDPLWDPSFKGRSVAASDWEMKITDIGENAIDWSKVTDIVLYLDTMGSNLQ